MNDEKMGIFDFSGGVVGMYAYAAFTSAGETSGA